MNKRYTHFSQSKISGEPLPPSSPSGSRAAMSAPSTASWPGAAGPKGPGWGSAMSGFKELSQGAKQDMANDKGLSMAKAKKMLKDNSAQGHPLTDKQKRLFGAIAGGNARKKY